jgi:hypothetical protein
MLQRTIAEIQQASTATEAVNKQYRRASTGLTFLEPSTGDEP